jgi:hypothetical protein
MRIKRDIYNFNRDSNVRINVYCCAFDRLLDVSISNGVYGGFQLAVSYLTSDEIARDKQFVFLVKFNDQEVEEESIPNQSDSILPTFLKSESISLCNSIEVFYIFYFEIKPLRELRNSKIDELANSQFT